MTGTADPPGQDEYPGDPIIVVTLQTFPFVLDKLGELEARNYAVIVDEAPSGQTGTSAGGMKEVLAAASLEEAEQEEYAGQVVDLEDELLGMVADRGPLVESLFGPPSSPGNRRR